ncbi:MAG: hypothetical protein RLZZ305_1388 [Actinomycetota bacterium]
MEPGLYDFTPATTRIHEPPTSAMVFDSAASATVLARSLDFSIEASLSADGNVVCHSPAVGAVPTLELITPAKSAALRLADSRNAASTDTCHPTVPGSTTNWAAVFSPVTWTPAPGVGAGVDGGTVVGAVSGTSATISSETEWAFVITTRQASVPVASQSPVQIVEAVLAPVLARRVTTAPSS